MKELNYPTWMATDLVKSGISTELARTRGFRPVKKKEADVIIGFAVSEDFEGYIIPYFDPASGAPLKMSNGKPFVRIRAMEPVSLGKDKKPAKYLTPKAGSQHAYVPADAHAEFIKGAEVILTEGEKKALAATANGLPCIGLSGNWGWVKNSGLDPQLARYIDFAKDWFLIWDSDAVSNAEFRKSEQALADRLHEHGITLHRLHMPSINGKGKTGLDDFIVSENGSVDKVRELIGTKAARIFPTQWPLLETKPTFDTLPEFPCTALPERLRDMVAAVAKFAQVPIEMAATAVLGTVGMAASSAYVTGPKKGIEVRANFYNVIFCPPATRKSTVFKAASRAVSSWIKDRLHSYNHYTDEMAIVDERVRKLTAALSKPGLPDAEVAEIQNQITLEQDGVVHVRNPSFIVNDFTPEAAMEVMDSTGGMLFIATDDGRGFAKILFGRYSNNTEESLLVSAYHGDSPLYRRRAKGVDMHVEAPRVSLLVFIQSDYLKQFAQQRAFFDSGLMTRVIPVVPDSLVGKRDADGKLIRAFSAYEIPEHVQKEFEAFVHLLLDQSYSDDPEVYLPLAQDAFRVWETYFNRTEALLGDWIESADKLGEMAGRYADHALRFALLHAVCRGAKSISRHDVECGIQLQDYFHHHVLRAVQAMDEIAVPLVPARIIKHLRRNMIQKFKAVDLTRNIGKLTDVDRDEALEWLCQKEYLRPVERHVSSTTKSPGRKPSPEFICNPNIFKENV